MQKSSFSNNIKNIIKTNIKRKDFENYKFLKKFKKSKTS